MNSDTTMKPNPAVNDLKEPTITSEPSTVLDEALADFQKSRSALDQDEFCNWEQAWSVLANQFVGHENL